MSKIFKRGNLPGASTSRSYARELPRELLDMIIAQLRLDTPTLKACSATCRAWYTATLPHLHHTLTLRKQTSDRTSKGLVPLHKLGKLQLLPFVKRLRILQHDTDRWFPMTVFDARRLAYFPTLTNVQELGIDSLDLQVFTLQAHLYSWYFMPKLRSLALRNPVGSHHQLLSFLGQFPNLDDLKLIHSDNLTRGSTPDSVPVPQLAPSLRGQLTLWSFGEGALLRDLSRLAGGLRFRHMNLRGVSCSRFLLDACAETLETLRLHTVDWRGKGHSRESSLV